MSDFPFWGSITIPLASLGAPLATGVGLDDPKVGTPPTRWLKKTSVPMTTSGRPSPLTSFMYDVAPVWVNETSRRPFTPYANPSAPSVKVWLFSWPMSDSDCSATFVPKFGDADGPPVLGRYEKFEPSWYTWSGRPSPLRSRSAILLDEFSKSCPTCTPPGSAFW